MPETLVIIKPDAVQRGLVGKIITRIENKGLTLVKLELRTLTSSGVAELYEKFVQQSFYNDLRDFMVSGPCIVMIVDSAISRAIHDMRKMIGAGCHDADGTAVVSPGTIRGDFGTNYRYNVIHASDSLGNAAKEIRFFFPGYLGP